MWGEEACLMRIVPALDSIFSSNYTVSTLSDLRKVLGLSNSDSLSVDVDSILYLHSAMLGYQV